MDVPRSHRVTGILRHKSPKCPGGHLNLCLGIGNIEYKRVQTLTLASDAGSEDVPAEANDEPPENPPEREDAGAEEEQPGDDLGPEKGPEELAAPEGGPSEPPAEDPELDASADLEDGSGPKEAEFPPIEPAPDDGADVAGENDDVEKPSV